MKKIIVGGLFFLVSNAITAQAVKFSKVIADAEKQTVFMLQQLDSVRKTNTNPGWVSPRSMDNGNFRMVTARDWTSGFFPGELWFLYEATGNPQWKLQAEAFTKNIESQQYDKSTHDLGFKIYCSAGAAYANTKSEHYKQVIIQASKTLIKRFNPLTGTIKSWDHFKIWGHPVIIDNMMNLEMLFAATKLTGDSSYYKVAVSHANATLKNHFREDNSSWHVVDYDTTQAGKIKEKKTHQGYSDESAWARGQAWGLYGYTMCYRETKNELYLEQAEKISDYIFNHKNLPADLVPYWDYNAPGIPNVPRDVSAATITASALYELSLYSKRKKQHLKNADIIIGNVTGMYRAAVGSHHGFLLLHSTRNLPAKGEIDVPIVYADYYYLEALLRSQKLKKKQKLFNN